MQLTVVKVGGNIIDHKEKLSGFLKDFSMLEGHKVLVHGGGKIATDIGRKMGIEPAYINGRRITDGQTLDLVTMVYGGLINKKIVTELQSVGCNAIGLTGADGGILPAEKRPVKDIDYGYVGDVSSGQVNSTLLGDLLKLGLVPVLAPLTFDANGILNTNADTIAQEVAKAMSAAWDVSLIYCFEKKGVLADAGDDDSVISNISSAGFRGLVESRAVTGGMIPKLENALEAVRCGVHRVVIGHADDIAALCGGQAGTSVSC